MHSNKIIHFVSPGPDSVANVLESQLGLSLERSRELFALGSLYLNKERFYDPGQTLDAGDYVRIHSDPRRYQRPVDLGKRLIAETHDWWIIDKPSGIPCHATVDNGIENLRAWMSAELNHELHITHRLDVPTSGCLVMAKSTEGVRHFNKLLLKNRVHKEYETLVEGNFETDGLVTHWMKKDNWAPREVYAEERPDTLLCQLEVLEREPFGHHTRLLLKLLTGRTHQIRVQMQALGHPVLNDVMYGAQRCRNEEIIALRARKLVIQQAPGEFLTFEAPMDWSSWI